MVKDFNINAVYDGKRHIFQCPQSEFLNAAAQFYSIDVSMIDLYVVEKGNRRRIISEYEIGDLMKVEIVKKGSKMEQRTLRSFHEDEPLGRKETIDRIIGKLKNNNVLNGRERKFLLGMLEDCSKDPAGKRKHEDDSNGPKMIHKRVQVHPSSKNSKDSSVQTESSSQNGDENHNEPPQASTSHSKAQEEDAIIRIKKMAGCDQVNKAEVKQLMDDTFNARRHFILMDAPLLRAVEDKFPLLFSVDEVKNELERLFYPGKCEEFFHNIQKYSSVIIDNCDPSNEIYARTIKSIERAKTKEQKRYAKAVGSILLLPTLMKEKLGFLNLQDNDCRNDIFPYIDASVHVLKEVFFDNLLFKVITEQRELCVASDFKEAVLCLMASFFIFNINYPETCDQTLILFEKLYLCANDTSDDLVVGDTQQMIKFLKLKANSV